MKKYIHLFESITEGIIVLDPPNLRAVSDETLQEIIDHYVKTSDALLKPRRCPFCGSPE